MNILLIQKTEDTVILPQSRHDDLNVTYQRMISWMNFYIYMWVSPLYCIFICTCQKLIFESLKCNKHLNWIQSIDQHMKKTGKIPRRNNSKQGKKKQKEINMHTAVVAFLHPIVLFVFPCRKQVYHLISKLHLIPFDLKSICSW